MANSPLPEPHDSTYRKEERVLRIVFILLAELNINSKSLNFTISPMDVTKSLDLTDKILDIANRYYIPPIGPIWNEVSKGIS